MLGRDVVEDGLLALVKFGGCEVAVCLGQT